MNILSAVQQWSIACLFAAAQGAALGQNQTDDLKGPAFSDPDQSVVKPDDWIAQPVRYTEWAEHADVAIMIEQSFRFLIDTVKEYAQANGIDVAIREGRCGNKPGYTCGNQRRALQKRPLLSDQRDPDPNAATPGAGRRHPPPG